MSHILVQTEQVVAARPEEVWAFLTDYRNKRPQILTNNFLNYTVEKGGIGAGTVISYHLHAANRERFYRMLVSEPSSGKVLTERDEGSSLITTWTLIPTENDQQTRVQLSTDWEGGKGIGGFFEKTFAPMGLRRIYEEMLGKLATVYAGGGSATKV
jgi:Polyketide cyclase / dehydrase and lipid transport